MMRQSAHACTAKGRLYKGIRSSDFVVPSAGQQNGGKRMAIVLTAASRLRTNNIVLVDASVQTSANLRRGIGRKPPRSERNGWQCWLNALAKGAAGHWT
jgi:hypothetical protein